MLRLLPALLLLAACSAPPPAVTTAGGTPWSPPEPVASRPGGIAARVNGEIVTWDEVELRIKVKDPAQREQYRLATLRQIAEERLFQQEAKKYGVKISDSQIDDSIKNERKQFRSDTDFLSYISRTLGMSLSEFREQRRSMLLMHHLVQKMIFDSTRNPSLNSRILLEFVSPDEMKTYFDGHKDEFREILVVDVFRLCWVHGDAEERARFVRVAESVRRRLLQGDDPVAMAMHYLDAQRMPKDATGKPIFRYSGLSPDVSEFEPSTNDVIFRKLKQGEVSEVVHDRNTVNLFYLIGKIEEKARNFDEAQPLIRRKLEYEKMTQNRKILRDLLIRRSYIEPADLFPSS